MTRYSDSPDYWHCPACAMEQGWDCENNCLPDEHRVCGEHQDIGLASYRGY